MSVKAIAASVATKVKAAKKATVAHTAPASVKMHSQPHADTVKISHGKK